MSNPRPKQTAADFDPAVLKLFDQYVHGGIDRRGFLDGVARYAVAGTTAVALLEALSPRFAEAQQVSKTDPRIKAETVEFASPRGYGKARGYLVRPATPVPMKNGASGALTAGLPTVLVIHENRGLNPHIEDITRRLALENFVAFAPDALYPLGGYPGDEDKARELFGKLDQTKTHEDFVAAARFVEGTPGGNGKLGAIGFCWGGSMVNFLATRLPDLTAGAPFYGEAPALDKVPNIKATMLFAFAGNDDRINNQWPAYDAALKAANVPHEAYRYDGTQHGFNNDTTPRYDDQAAALAWQRAMALFNRALR